MKRSADKETSGSWSTTSLGATSFTLPIQHTAATSIDIMHAACTVQVVTRYKQLELFDDRPDTYLAISQLSPFGKCNQSLATSRIRESS